uniref:Uncharacterized protein n=1 Tax=Oryza glaberrima TaxID=4538 RepID=I1NZV2_ORYGL
MLGGGVVDGIRRWLRRHGRTASAYQPHPSGDGGLEVVLGPFTLPAAIRVPARTSPPPPPSDSQLKKESLRFGTESNISISYYNLLLHGITVYIVFKLNKTSKKHLYKVGILGQDFV